MYYGIYTNIGGWFYMLIGQRIKAIRVKQGMSIDELAQKLGKNRTTIYRYENGEIENLPLSILDSLADALNTTPANIMGWTETKYTDPEERKVKTVEVLFVARWLEEIGANKLREDECVKVMEYAKFLLSQRDK